MPKKKNNKNHLKKISNTHLFDYCDWCETCKPSSIPHYPVNIRSSEGHEVYWVCQVCLDNSYIEAEKEFKKHRRKLKNGNARKTKKATKTVKSKTKKKKEEIKEENEVNE